MNHNKRLPLDGIKVVELATVVAAPTTSRMLAAYGAEVIKVETINGDPMRRAGVTEVAPYEDYKNPLFTVNNSNKRLISINIKSEEGKVALFKLIENADVFITNVREESLGRLGLDYETLKETCPELIYAHFSGYGNDGPVAKNPGFDSTAFWLRSGPLADWQVKGYFPFVPTYAFGDMSTSSVLLSGILMALMGREKSGEGTKVECSLFGSGIWCNAIGVISTQFERQHLNPDPLRPRNPFATLYECADEKWIGFYINEYLSEKEKFANILGMRDILDDPRYDSIDSLAESGAIVEAVERVQKIFKTKTSSEWRKYLSANSVSCEVMQSTHDVSRDEQAIANHYVEEVEFADNLKVMMPCPPVFFSNYGRRQYEPTGRIGEDTQEVFSMLGYTEEEIGKLREAGTIL
ncbi:MAG: CaiB/BaiF CoA-transferase family protein [Oscillospiraceae bacterium]